MGIFALSRKQGYNEAPIRIMGVMEYLWRNDIEEVSCQSVLLCEHVVFICFKGNAKHVDDEGAGRQVEGDAVLAQERLQLRCLLLQELQCHFCTFGGKQNRYLFVLLTGGSFL